MAGAVQVGAGEPAAFQGYPDYPGRTGELGGVIGGPLVLRVIETGAGFGDGGVGGVAVRDQSGEPGLG